MSNDNVIASVIGFFVGVFFTALIIGFVMTSNNAILNDTSIQCGKLGYDKAFYSGDVYYCAHELERIDE